MALSQDNMSAYHHDGVPFPKRVMSAEAASELLAGLEAYERETGGPVNGNYRYRCHLVFPWINELMRHEGILDLVADLIGPGSQDSTNAIGPNRATSRAPAADASPERRKCDPRNRPFRDLTLVWTGGKERAVIILEHDHPDCHIGLQMIAITNDAAHQAKAVRQVDDRDALRSVVGKGARHDVDVRVTVQRPVRCQIAPQDVLGPAGTADGLRRERKAATRITARCRQTALTKSIPEPPAEG